MSEPKTYGQIAFDAYRKTVNDTAYDGTPIPEWHALKELVQFAWEAAALAVIQHWRNVQKGKQAE